MLKARLEFKLQDCWIGVSWKRSEAVWADPGDDRDLMIATAPRVDTWICLLPCLPIHVVWEGKAVRTDPLDYAERQALTEKL